MPDDITRGELTHSQKQIWIGQRLHPSSPLYNMAFAFVFPPGLRADAFCDAWQRVADASDALRTRIREDGRGDAWWTLAERGRRTEVLDSALGREEFLSWASARCGQPLDARGVLLESVLVPLTDGGTGWYLNQHHLVADAWSTQLVYRQVAAEYTDTLARESARPAALPSYYRAAASLPSAEGLRAAALEHWRERRAAGVRTVPFYGRSGRPAGTRSTRLTLTLDAARSRALDECAGADYVASLSAGTSRFALLAMLLTAWLHRISGTTSLGFDAPVAGRPTPDARRAPGVFIEMLPFAIEVSPGDTFRALARRCLAEASLFLRHALPGMSAPSAATSSSVVLNYVPDAFGPFAGLCPDVEWVHPGHGDSVHALRVQVHDFAGSGAYTLHFDFNDAALEDRLRRRSLRHFEAMLDAFLADPDQPVAAVDILTPEERHALAALNATGSARLPSEPVVATFERRAAAEGDRVALRQGADEVSFRALRDRASAVAAVLRAEGVRPGDRVAVAAPRSIDAVVAILGVLKARGAFVPIDAAAPPARAHHVIEDSGARVVLVGGAVRLERVPSGTRVLDIAAAVRGGAATQAPEPGPRLDDLAYVMYTSGSTGRPKGVPIGHAGLADYICWAEREYVRGERLTYALATSLAFDLTITSLFLPLVSGGTLDIYPEGEGPADTGVLDAAAANRVDFVKLTPSHLSVLRRAGLAGSRIRRMVVGGEDLRSSLAAAVLAQLPPGAEMFNEYGPTEAVVGCVAHRFDPARDFAASVPIGRPADHVHVAVLNEAQTPVPEGVPGELWVSRHGLARGYHGHPDLSKERFQPDPADGGRLRYRTGDLVRMADASSLEYLGRIDRQVKIAGYRVEPAEIEAALLSLAGVLECALVVDRKGSSVEAAGPVRHCARCALPSTYPGAALDAAGICGVCRAYDAVADRARAYFRTMDDLRALFSESAKTRGGAFDCLMLYSGGKDSTYALCRLAEMGLSVRAFTLDNGFISEGAKDNIRRVTGRLGVPIDFATAPGMNAIFRDSLARYANVCNGCFKTIYTLGMLRARELQIPIVVTGLSRGQMFETRLSEEMFRAGVDARDVDAAVLAARKAYHRAPDEVARVLDVRAFQDDRIFEEVQIVDFFRYCDAPLDEMLRHIARVVPWVRPADTGRSTNCLINELGIHVHQRERGYHSYALPYSWDVRLGHKTREAALEELDDKIDPARVRSLLSAIGAEEEDLAGGSVPALSLAAFYVASRDVEAEEVRAHLAARLPPQMIPLRLQRVGAFPLTANGKVDEHALLRDARSAVKTSPYVEPVGPVEEFLARVWQEELGAVRVGAADNFFELGGTSLTAMQMIIRLCREFDVDVPLATVFTHPRLSDLARLAEDRIMADVAGPADP